MDSKKARKRKPTKKNFKISFKLEKPEGSGGLNRNQTGLQAAHPGDGTARREKGPRQAQGAHQPPEKNQEDETEGPKGLPRRTVPETEGGRPESQKTNHKVAEKEAGKAGGAEAAAGDAVGGSVAVARPEELELHVDPVPERSGKFGRGVAAAVGATWANQ